MLLSKELASWSAALYDTHRFQVLLSVHYYRTTLLINSPILTSFLINSDPEKNTTNEVTSLLEVNLLAIKKDFTAARELERIVRGLNEAAPGFYDNNAAWWTCNFSSRSCLF